MYFQIKYTVGNKAPISESTFSRAEQARSSVQSAVSTRMRATTLFRRAFASSSGSPHHGVHLGSNTQRTSAFFPESQDETIAMDYHLSEGNIKQIVVYDGAKISAMLDNSDLTSKCPNFNRVATEWVRVIDKGPGVLVIKNAFPDHDNLDRVSETFLKIVTEERSGGVAAGDHFAKAGANDRIWNALEKHAVMDPESYVPYYNNKLLAAASRAWLGPHYQMTSQVNSSHPGSPAQDPHCDYHLGFRSNAECAEFPSHVHAMSKYLTLQGAVAHVDMPIHSGPTTFLPYSQNFERNYFTWRDEQFKEYYQQNMVQLSLDKGDAVFFNPGLIHAAGNNISEDIDRMANLVQVNSAFGQCMESIDCYRIVKCIYPELLRLSTESGDWKPYAHAIVASTLGNAFPTNLDRDVPDGGSPPPALVDVLHKALEDKVSVDELDVRLEKHQWLRQTS